MTAVQQFGTDRIVMDRPQEFAPCNHCHAGMMMLHSNGAIVCESCDHEYPTLVDGNPATTEETFPITEDEDAWF